MMVEIADETEGERRDPGTEQMAESVVREK